MELRAFEGRWRIERDIEDVKAGRTGRFAGEAVFAPVLDGLAYVETGTLTLQGAAPMAASRRYLWRAGGPGTIEVLFEDGRFFHRIDAEEPTSGAVHACAPDLYRVRYDFRGWPRWLAEWRVSGPRKDYAMVSRYAPARGAPLGEAGASPGAQAVTSAATRRRPSW
ncbi:MAG: DUF6314 family protein [Amaricoccus sp.]|uniref:DUF6314 family protein n=1 Tax=Amaricoccus sp. TaxID=1872485 RepID=UPI0039E426BE